MKVKFQIRVILLNEAYIIPNYKKQPYFEVWKMKKLQKSRAKVFFRENEEKVVFSYHKERNKVTNAT